MKLGLRRHANTHHPHRGSDPLLFLAGLPSRIVYGSVLNDGTTVDAGSNDWTVVRTGLNTYTFTVTPAFGAEIVNVVATPGFNGDTDDPYLAITDPGAADLDTFVVLTYDFIGDASSSAFSFAAIEDPV